MIRPAILGLDPSTKLIGWGLTSMEGEAIGCGWVPIETTLRKEDEENEIRVPLDRFRATKKAVREVSKAVDDLECEIVGIAVEHPVSFRLRSKEEVIFACGMAAQAACSYFNTDVIEYEPQEWKGIVGLTTPRDPDNRRKTLKADDLIHYVQVENPWWDDEQMLAYKRAPGQFNKRMGKPHIFVKALELGYGPDKCGHSQDAADAAMISLAHWMVLDEAAAKVAA